MVDMTCHVTVVGIWCFLFSGDNGEVEEKGCDLLLGEVLLPHFQQFFLTWLPQGEAVKGQHVAETPVSVDIGIDGILGHNAFYPLDS